MFLNHVACKELWPRGLLAKTLGFQPGEEGSIPFEATIYVLIVYWKDASV